MEFIERKLCAAHTENMSLTELNPLVKAKSVELSRPAWLKSVDRRAVTTRFKYHDITH